MFKIPVVICCTALVIFSMMADDGFASHPMTDVPGTIPLNRYARPFATDLFYQNKILLSHEARRLARSGVNLAKIDPKPSSLWKNSYIQSLKSVYKKLPVDAGDNVGFNGLLKSRAGNFRFTAFSRKKNSRHLLTFMISKKVHNVLLRDGLLKKIGFKVPGINYLKTVRLDFSDTLAKKTFRNELAQGTFGDPKRWIVKEGDQFIELQDLIVMESNPSFYNLALGFVPRQIIRGRRILNSLIAPFSIADVPESVNMFSWSAGRMVARHVKIDYEEASEFSPSIDDVRWMMEKLIWLDRQDFADIVKQAHYPKAVAALVLEKMISRRNSLNRLLKIGANSITFSPKKKYGKHLKNGKLDKKNWKGYGSRFSFGDPDNPLSGSEIFAFVKSRGLSTLILNTVNALNRFLRLDLQGMLKDRMQKMVIKNFENFVKTGKMGKTPFGFFALPTLGFNLIASRDIVAGTYLGTDNLVQLVDTIGFSVEAGAFIGTDGVPAPWGASGGVKGYFTRSYSHIRPIKSMKKALKIPFKNILVPLQRHKMGNLLNKAYKLLNLPKKERQKPLTKIITEFKNRLSIGESLVITDSIGAGVNFGVTANYTQFLQAGVTFFGSQLVLSRVHIMRAAENIIQVYQDKGSIGRVGLTFFFKPIVPILKVSMSLAKGKASINYFNLNIEDNIQKNPTIFKQVMGLATLLARNSVDNIRIFQKPYKVDHYFHQRAIHLTFFHWRWLKQRTHDSIEVTHPKGHKRYFYHHLHGNRHGVNYLGFLTDVLNGALSLLTKEYLSIANKTNNNSGDTPLGNSTLREIRFEGEIENYKRKKKKGRLINSYIEVAHLWKGWSIKKKGAQKILDKINKRFHYQFFPSTTLNTTKRLQLYAISLKILFYKKAIDSMATAPPSLIDDLLENHARIKERAPKLLRANGYDRYKLQNSKKLDDDLRDKVIRKLYRRFRWYQKKYLQYLKEGRIDQISHYAIKMASFSDHTFTKNGLFKLVGGPNNVYAYARLSGFRTGDEKGDSPVLSSSFGNFGHKYVLGPLYQVRQQMKMTEAEFFIYWLIGKM